MKQEHSSKEGSELIAKIKFDTASTYYVSKKLEYCLSYSAAFGQKRYVYVQTRVSEVWGSSSCVIKTHVQTQTTRQVGLWTRRTRFVFFSQIELLLSLGVAPKA